MKNSLVSIIVPCYNQAQYLEEALQSVLDQTYQNWECIVVNDGSPDNTEEVAKKWIEKDSRFKYLFKENGGVSSARNLGVEKAKGEFILPLDADDYITRNYVFESVANIEHTKSKVVFGRSFFFEEIEKEFYLESKVEVKDLLQCNKIHCSGFYRKEDFVLAGGYDENMKFGFEDWEFWINMLKNGGVATKLENCSLFYRIKKDSRSTEINNEPFKKQQMAEYILKKHILSYGYSSVLELYKRNMKLEKILERPAVFFTLKEILLIMLNKIVNKIKS